MGNLDSAIKDLPLDWTGIASFATVIGGTLVATLFAALRVKWNRWLVLTTALATAAGGIWFSIAGLGGSATEVFNRMMVLDPYGSLFNILFLSSGALTLLLSVKYLDREDLHYPEYTLLLLYSIIGMMFMVSAQDLIVVFISLEIMSLSVYVLVGFRRADRKSNEAAMKYFVLGGIASAILLYGVALLYGATGSIQIKDILAHATRAQSAGGAGSLFQLGGWLVLSGFLFKVASVPFHMWMPDVYEGAPAPITGFMTTGLKAASFAAFIRFSMSLGPAIEGRLHDLLWICAALTMVAGNVIALTQNSLKRMLAYSSISHTGYLLVGLLAATHPAQREAGLSASVMYLVTYAVMNIGAFGVLTVLSGKGDSRLMMHDLAGLSRKHPWLAFTLAVFMFSMAGIPPTAGFVSKYLLFHSAVQAGELSIVILAVLCSAISVYYYLRVLVAMYMQPAAGEVMRPLVGVGAFLVLVTTVVLTFQWGIAPAALVDLAKRVAVGL